METPPTRYDLIKLCHLKEENVWLDRNVSSKASFNFLDRHLHITQEHSEGKGIFL
jgi:hypothetical protein